MVTHKSAPNGLNTFERNSHPQYVMFVGAIAKSQHAVLSTSAKLRNCESGKTHLVDKQPRVSKIGARTRGTSKGTSRLAMMPMIGAGRTCRAFSNVD